MILLIHRTVPNDGAINSLYVTLHTINPININRPTGDAQVFIQTQIYRETLATPGVFKPVAGTLVSLPILFIDNDVTLAILRGNASGLNITLNAGKRLIVFSNLKITNSVINGSNAIAGHFSAGIAISSNIF